MTPACALAGVDLLIGIDDTDDLYSPGTGRRARQLLDELTKAGLGTPAGVTRHQLLVDDRIPYTTHNSDACIAWRSAGGDPDAVVGEVIAMAGRFLERVCPPAADPGLVVAIPSRIADTGELMEFGRRAKREVLRSQDAWKLGAALGVHISGHGGTQEGVIGALAGVGLHLSGDDGLFIHMPGLYDLPPEASLDDLRRLIGIDDARDGANRRPEPGEPIELSDWVRPVLLDGRAVLLLDPPWDLPDGRRAWRTAPRYVVKRF